MYYQCAETGEGIGIHDHVQNTGNKAGVVRWESWRSEEWLITNFPKINIWRINFYLKFDKLKISIWKDHDTLASGLLFSMASWQLWATEKISSHTFNPSRGPLKQDGCEFKTGLGYLVIETKQTSRTFRKKGRGGGITVHINNNLVSRENVSFVRVLQCSGYKVIVFRGKSMNYKVQR